MGRIQFTTGKLLFATAAAAVMLWIGNYFQLAWYGTLLFFGPLWLLAVGWEYLSNISRVLSVGAYLAYWLSLIFIAVQQTAMAATPRPMAFGPELALIIMAVWLGIIGLGLWAFSRWRDKK